MKTEKTKYLMPLKQTAAYFWELQPRMVRTVSTHHLQAANHQARLNVVLNRCYRMALYDLTIWLLVCYVVQLKQFQLV